MSEELEVYAEKEELECTDTSCKRKHRPNFNNHYSADPKIRMKELQQEKRIGGTEYGSKGGRPRKPRAGAIVAEKIQEHADEFGQVLIDGVRSSNDKIRLMSVNTAMDIERHETKLQMEEEKHDKEMSKDELMAGIQNMLNSNPVLKLAMQKLLVGDEKPKADYEAEIVGEVKNV